jgi:hypothetical protein
MEDEKDGSGFDVAEFYCSLFIIHCSLFIVIGGLW